MSTPLNGLSKRLQGDRPKRTACFVLSGTGTRLSLTDFQLVWRGPGYWPKRQSLTSIGHSKVPSGRTADTLTTSESFVDRNEKRTKLSKNLQLNCSKPMV